MTVAGVTEKDLTRETGFEISRGSTWQLQLTLYEDENNTQLKDLTGYIAVMQARDEYDTDTALIDLTTEGSAGNNIVLGGVNGTLVAELNKAASTALPNENWKGVYEIIIEKDGVREPVMRGNIQIIPAVVQD